MPMPHENDNLYDSIFKDVTDARLSIFYLSNYKLCLWLLSGAILSLLVSYVIMATPLLATAALTLLPVLILTQICMLAILLQLGDDITKEMAAFFFFLLTFTGTLILTPILTYASPNAVISSFLIHALTCAAMSLYWLSMYKDYRYPKFQFHILTLAILLVSIILATSGLELFFNLLAYFLVMAYMVIHMVFILPLLKEDSDISCVNGKTALNIYTGALSITAWLFSKPFPKR